MNQKSLQININSEADAMSVVAHLQYVKVAYDANGCDSVEFYVAQPVRKVLDSILRGAIPWCITYVKEVPLGDGNVYFELPHYVLPAANSEVIAVRDPETGELRATPGNARRTLGKSLRPVTVDRAAAA